MKGVPSCTQQADQLVHSNPTLCAYFSHARHGCGCRKKPERVTKNANLCLTGAWLRVRGQNANSDYNRYSEYIYVYIYSREHS